jgi:putative transposase
MRFALIDAAKVEFPVHRMCRALGVSQSGYFAWKDRPACRRQREDMVLLAYVRSAFALSHGTYGSPRMTRELHDSGLAVGRRRTARLMRENGLRARQKRRFKRTTDSHHAWPVAPNLLDQDFAATRPDEKWGADISYIWTREGWLYLAVVIDLFARRVVGWSTGDRLHRDLAPRRSAKHSSYAARLPG